MWKPRIQTNVWKVQNTTGRFLAQLHPSNFVLKVVFLVPKVSNSWIFQKRCFMKIICHRIQTLLFQACLPTRQNGVENRDKAYSELIFIYIVSCPICGAYLCQQTWFHSPMNAKVESSEFPTNYLACVCVLRKACETALLIFFFFDLSRRRTQRRIFQNLLIRMWWNLVEL